LRTAELVDRLTLAEKAALTSGVGLWDTHPVPRLGVEAITFSDGPHGLRRPAPRLEGGDGSRGSVPATCFPPEVALGSSWDRDLCRRVGEALGQEARALGAHVLLAPGVNIKRSPLCGRNFEYLAEDPFLSSALGAALIEGIQSEGVGACIKHFAANNQETDRLRVSADIDERPLREIYLAAFEDAIKQAKPWAVMCSYNKVNGVYASENHWLLTEVLRHEWGFEGLVVSDWGAVDDIVAALRAGLDLEMPTSGGRGPERVAAAVEAGSLATEDLDRSVGRVLALVDRATSTSGSGRFLDLDDHHRFARDAAAQCVVLLRNDGVLPLDPGQRIAVIGELAATPRLQGGGSSKVQPTRVDIPLAEMETLAGRSLPFAPGYRLGSFSADASLIYEASVLASASDVAVVFLGLTDEEESEGFDRRHLELPLGQLVLLEAIVSAGPKVVVVLSNGGVVRVSGWEEGTSALLEAWLLGQAGGGAVADILFGVVSPSGRLAETIPRRLQDNPSFHNFPGEHGRVRYGEGIFVGYRHYDALDLEVSYPFGHGLSYTSFAYEDLALEVSGAEESLQVGVSLRVSNVGDREGKEVVQLYVGHPAGSVGSGDGSDSAGGGSDSAGGGSDSAGGGSDSAGGGSDSAGGGSSSAFESSARRPRRELRGFSKVSLRPGESVPVRFSLSWRDFAYWHTGEHRWVVPADEVTVEIGASSRDIRLGERLLLPVSAASRALTLESPLREWVSSERGRQVLEDALKAPADGSWPRSRILGEESLRVMGSIPLGRLARFPGVGLDLDTLEAALVEMNAR
jgi:beta-glucosidase